MKDADARRRIEEAYAEIERRPNPESLKRRAGAHRPEDDAEADRLAALDYLPPAVRLAVGYHQAARDAAQQLNELEEK